MKKLGAINVNLSRNLALVSPGFQGLEISSGSCCFFEMIFFGTQVTFLSWHAYPVIKPKLNGVLLSCLGVIGNQFSWIVAGKRIINE